MPEESGCTKKSPDLSVICRRCHLSNASKAIVSQFHTLLGHFVPQEGDFFPEKMTFRGLELQSMLPESFKHCPQPEQVFLLSPGEDDDIIQIDKGICEV